MSGTATPAPFDTVRLPPGSAVLVLAPHPDDFDAIGVTMRLLHGRGHALHVAVATSGASGVDAANAARVAALPLEVRPAAVFLPHGHDTSVGHQRTYALLRAGAAAIGAVPAACRVPPSGSAAARGVPSEDAAGAPFSAFLNVDPKTRAMRYDVVTPYGAAEAAWKGELLRFHRSQQERNLRSRGRGVDERILEMDRDTAAACGVGAPYAEVFEMETFDTWRGGA